MQIRVAAVIGVAGLAFSFLSACGGQARPNAVRAPVRVVHVAWGSIGYRAVGHGRPLVLLAGSPGGNIDNWAPSLVDGLAGGSHVYAMDYEGTGHTSVHDVPGKITVARLADDTADFIRALHLAPADVMGWSFGTFVAQSLAVRHPALVHRLVLAAPAPGDGTALENNQPPSSYTCRGSGKWWAAFPYDAKGCAAARAYLRAIRTYPDYAFEAQVSAAVQQAEDNAAIDWFTGLIPEGQMAAKIRVPVLVGGGTQDQLLPAPDSANVANALPHATLKLYPDAAHAFLMQHAADWTRIVLHFLHTS